MNNRYYSPHNLIKSYCLRQKSPTIKYFKSTTNLKLQQLKSNIDFKTQPQKYIGNYMIHLQHEIGIGYSSKVYEATNVKNKKKYAVKIINLRKCNTSNLSMLQNEINIMKQVQHPNIIKCHDLFNTLNFCYIVMQLCTSDLNSFIKKKKGRICEKQTIEIMQQIINGVQYLIKQGIIHRDLKPANILKKDNTWKIADFGFAIKQEKCIKTRYNVGTPLYMPLQVLFRNQYSYKSDIFAVGIIFYQIIFGLTPWQSQNEKQLKRKMNQLPLIFSKQISEQNQLIIRKMCTMNRQERMTKEQFNEINLHSKKINRNNFHKPYSALQKSDRSNSPLYKTIGNIQSVFSLSTQAEQKQQKNNNQEIQKYCKNILIGQLNFCRFLYYMLKNQQYFLIHENHRQYLFLIIFKYLYKITKQLADSKINWFNLPNWQQFHLCKIYITTHLTLKQYALRYQKQYLNYLKHTSINLVRQVNYLYTDLNSNNNFTLNFYQIIANKIQQLLKQFISNLEVIIEEQFRISQLSFYLTLSSKIKFISQNKQLSSTLKGNIHALKSLYKYYEILKLTNNINKIQELQQLKICINFSNSSQSLIENIFQIKKLIIKQY